MKIEEKLKNYIELVDKACLFEDEKKFDQFCIIYKLQNGLCLFLKDTKDYESVIKKGFKIIRRNYIKKFFRVSPNKHLWWFWVITSDGVNLNLKKESLKARQQVVKDILDVYYPNSIYKFLINLHRRL